MGQSSCTSLWQRQWGIERSNWSSFWSNWSFRRRTSKEGTLCSDPWDLRPYAMTHLPHEDGGHDDVHGIAKREWTQMTNETSKGAHRGELRIVVGIDGSPCADQAVEFAAHEAA